MPRRASLVLLPLLARWLIGWGYGVGDVGSAVEALEVMETDPADIVLCDIAMPEHDGHQKRSANGW